MEFITATVRQREASIALADGRELGGQVGKAIGDQMYDLDLALDAALQRVRIPQARRVRAASRGTVSIARLTRGRSPGFQPWRMNSASSPIPSRRKSS